jgi:serine/alanine racemase
MKKTYEQGRAWIESNKNNLKHNIEVLRSLLPAGCVLMPAIKANAYGHGVVPMAKELNKMGVQAFCVASVAEAVQLRENGVVGEILILGYTHPSDFPLLIQYNLTQAVLDYEYAEMLDAFGSEIKAHIAVDTGMHRVGVPAENLDAILSMLKMKHLWVTGIYTHLCADDSQDEKDVAFTKKQAASFASIKEQVLAAGYALKTHILGSYGLLNYPELGGDYVRIGIALYGVLSNRGDLAFCPVELRPVLSVKARVMTIRTIQPGEHVGYGLAYTAESERKIAALSIGYADGLPRALSCGRGRVLIHGQEAPIVGRICMDQTMVDVTGIENVKCGDIAVIIGKSDNLEITAYELAEQSDTITNEILSRMGNRLNRLLI